MASKANDQPSPADVVIEPADLRFEVSLSRASIQHLALRNLACGRPVAFKIKTTNPKRYLVRPNAGIVWAEGAATVSVQVGVQKALPQPGDPKSRDKFQVLTLPLDKALTEEMLAAHGQGNEALRARVAALWASDAAKAAWVDKVRSSLVAADSGGVRGLSIPEERRVSRGVGSRDALSPRDAISSSPLVDQATAAALRKALEQERAIAAGLRQARASPSAASGAPSSQSGGISATTVALIALAAAAAGALLPLFLSPAASLDAPPLDAPPLDAGAGGV
ncbi:hypothetical protein EMIHUDRAFT_99733 [Emiliania huxleyi CCMP1516]|uniref:MSP domain-containing protein n=2 Tax=Emiliania huxleyi TaxID=2903 RepID=A0A0D3JNB2_EMIH1|nr:hypothetical protein EMIHUDRAFT_115704 [Emiliania huxleyi CCMP1516]XP_005781738.1 hypothetical protein EMIHUDRAFT_99733 [Emiliania huxleyi CCMP1516]EOD24997.1 hypothetical protein EMIHUDRAFT_115704 [Emiliania huxleyi CCMP1516]EOD29309.1 hypothetical protein EMIHUDRAFT_99733 [Emiliania huxleyi CCMP1516]|eukprot:XP_005777426.1 hypothetical protein EMIHUDRAFT_115704 [Emiliania huxleyi CCMP1516]